MSTNLNPEEISRFPKLGKLSIAILEHVNETFLGEKAVEELKAPVVQKELLGSLGEVLEHTEKRFRTDYEDTEIRETVLNLPLADLPSLKQALRSFYNRPTDPTLPQFLREQLRSDLHHLSAKRIDAAVSAYIRILREELIPVSDDISGKLSALATLGTEINTARIANLITRLLDALTVEQSSAIQKHNPATSASSVVTATNQGAQAGDIHVNVSLPSQIGVANPNEIPAKHKDDDSKPTNIGWDARDLTQLRRYFRMGRKHDPKLFKRELDVDERKARDHLVTSGLIYLAHDGHLYLTHAGVLLCCKQDRLPRDTFYTHVKFKDTSNIEELTVELFGSVLYLYNELHRLLKPIFQRRLGSSNTRDDRGSESVFFEYPEKAIIEALVNFLVHRDYFEDDMGRVTVYPEKIEFVNPGQSKYPPDVLLGVTSPLLPKYDRNQRLIEAMNKVRLNQRDGGGILTIKKELKKNESFRSDGSLGLSIENDSLKNRFVLTIYKRVPKVGVSERLATQIAPQPLGRLPPLPTLVVGREDALNDLKIRLGITTSGQTPSPIQILTAIRGWPGVGKTALAATLAHDRDIAKAYPDGVLWVSLGPTPNLLFELATWGRALSTDDLLQTRTVEEASAQLAAMLRNKRMLLIVDDVWESEHATPFKVGGRGCAMLITTRANSVAQALAPTPNDIYKLPVLTDENALELLKSLAPTVVNQYPEQSLELVHELEGLPLALQVVGHMLNVESSYGFNVIELLTELREGAKLLGAKAPVDQVNLANKAIPTVTVLLQKSTERLDDFTRDCFAYLGAFSPKPATFDLDAMKAVWQVEDPKLVARTLVDRGLLEYIPELGRYQMHALIVMHARSLLVDELSLSKSDYERLRHAKYYETILRTANELYLQGGEALKRGLSLLDVEWSNIQIGQSWAADHINVNAEAALLCNAYADDGADLLDLRLPPHEYIHWFESALNASRRLEKRDAEGRHLNRLGIAHRIMGNVQQAIKTYMQALSIIREKGDRRDEGNVLGNLGLAYADLGDVQRSIEFYKQALAIGRATGDRRGEGTTLNNLGMAYMYLGEASRAIEHYERALSIYDEVGDLRGKSNALSNLGIAHKSLGDIHQAIKFHEQAMVIYEEIGDRVGIGAAFDNLGNAYRGLRENRRAIEFYEQALTILQELGDRRGKGITLSNLGLAYSALGESYRAIEFYEQALVIFKEIGNLNEMGTILWHQSQAFEELGDNSHAIHYAKAALRIFEQIGSPRTDEVQEQLDVWLRRTNN